VIHRTSEFCSNRPSFRPNLKTMPPFVALRSATHMISCIIFIQLISPWNPKCGATPAAANVSTATPIEPPPPITRPPIQLPPGCGSSGSCTAVATYPNGTYYCPFILAPFRRSCRAHRSRFIFFPILRWQSRKWHALRKLLRGRQVLQGWSVHWAASR
jgi:hypothetical protein